MEDTKEYAVESIGKGDAISKYYVNFFNLQRSCLLYFKLVTDKKYYIPFFSKIH